MIKINLLPQSIFEKEVIRKLIMLFGLLLALIVAGGVGYRASLNSALAQKQQELQATQIIEQQAIQTKQQAEAEKAKIGPIQTKVNFVRDVMAYNEKAPQLYEELARWTYTKIRYRSISLTDTDMTIDAHAPSLSDAGRYLLNLYRATHIFSQVSMDSIPQFDSKAGAPGADDSLSNGLQNPEDMAAARRRLALQRARTPRQSTAFDFKVTCKLTQPFAAPAYGASGAAPAGAPGAPGMPTAAPVATPAATPAAPPAAGGAPASPPGGGGNSAPVPMP